MASKKKYYFKELVKIAMECYFFAQLSQGGGISPFREKICVSGRLGRPFRQKCRRAGRLGMFG